MPQNKYSADNPFAPEEKKYSADNPFVGEPSGVFGDVAGKTFLNNILAGPKATGSLIADILPGMSAALQGAGAKLTGGQFDFRRRLEEERGKFPANMASPLRAIPSITTNEFLAGLKTTPELAPQPVAPSDIRSRIPQGQPRQHMVFEGQDISGRFKQELGTLEAEDAAMRADSPFAAGAGEVFGDAMSLAAGRLPFARGISNLENKLMNRKLIEFDPKTITLPQEVISVADRLWKSQGMSKLLRGAGRATETGFEAAMLDLAKGDDALETAGYAAGIQAGGSLILEASKLVQGEGKGLVNKSAGTVLKVGAAALAAGTVIQIFRAVTPGGPDNPVDSVRVGFDKVMLGIALGLTASSAGLHRAGRGETMHPKIIDALTSLQRGSFLSILEEFSDATPEKQAQVESLLDGLVTNPSGFSEKRLKEIQSAFDKGTVVKDIEKLTFPELK